ncbi:MAG TPA: hypothetical protein VMP01_17585 [Pirellulaceae bacterium]|nr:hypothetical protein [Pirellulaceae bacterium]
MPVRRLIFACSRRGLRCGSLVALLTAAAIAAGCGQEPQIRQYQVPKLAVSSSTSGKTPPMPMAAPAERSTLGAIVLAGKSAWFFKMTGEPGAVASQKEAVTTFLRGVRFSAAGKPTWDLPAGWKERPGDQFRFATLELGDPPLDLAISELPRSEDGPSDEEYILQNVDRWRGQLGLEPTTSEALAKESEQFTIGNFPVTLVELTGMGSGTMGGPFSGGAGGGPFAGGELPKDHPPVTAGGSPAASAGRAGPVTYAVPEGWKERPAGGLRAASFEVVEGDKKLDISVIPLSLQGPAGDVTENVNRWRGQVGLAPQSAEDVAKELREVAGKGIKWQVVELAGESPSTGPQVILGAIGKGDSAAWFVKLTGPADLAQREKEHFDQFVGSLQVK